MTTSNHRVYHSSSFTLHFRVSMETEVFLLFNTEGLSVTKDLIQQERERAFLWLQRCTLSTRQDEAYQRNVRGVRSLKLLIVEK